jgi:hypothetical protein
VTLNAQTKHVGVFTEIVFKLNLVLNETIHRMLELYAFLLKLNYDLYRAFYLFSQKYSKVIDAAS